MKKNRFHHYLLCCLSLVLFFCSCDEPAVNNDDITRHLELIETNAKIKTFPLTIVLGEHLRGDSFPSEIKYLSGFSRQYCKTLPIAGLLRLGPNNYYTYNAISELKIPEAVENNEDAITVNIEQQVNGYLNKTMLDNFDSLLTPNSEELNIRALSLAYIHNTSDSVYFYSKSRNAPLSIRIGSRDYSVFTSSTELRKKIDNLVCNGRGAISVLYDPPIFDLAPGTTASNTNWPTRGRAAGDTCVGTLKFERLHDGTGGFMLGKLLESNSKACGFRHPTGIAGDTCVSGSKYQRLHNGQGGFQIGRLIERNSRSCGFTAPEKAAPEKPTPESAVPARPTPERAAPARPTPERATPERTTPPRATAERAAPDRRTPERATPARATPERATSERRTPERATSAGADNRCVRRSTPLCEQDGGGNYTGRRVQFCYNSKGDIVQTIVIERCDSDCRCIGR